MEWSQVQGGSAARCALTRDGNLYCWGWNNTGGVGNNTQQLQTLPFKVPLPGKVIFFTIGNNGTCAIVVGNDVYCWGGGFSTSYKPNPTFVINGALAVNIGRFHVCIKNLSGKSQCTGYSNGMGINAQPWTNFYDQWVYPALFDIDFALQQFDQLSQ